MQRREFFRRVGLAASAVVAFGADGKEALAQAENEPQPKGVEPGDLNWEKAPCRFCGTGCGVEVGIHEGKAVAVRGDEKSPVNKGLLCVKGYHLPAFLYGKDRIKYPMHRQPDGSLKRVSWDHALNLIARHLSSLAIDVDVVGVALFVETDPDGVVLARAVNE